MPLAECLPPHLPAALLRPCSTSHLLLAEGTVPMYYQGVKYNIPVALWLPERYPLQAPMAYVVRAGGGACGGERSSDSSQSSRHTCALLLQRHTNPLPLP